MAGPTAAVLLPVKTTADEIRAVVTTAFPFEEKPDGLGHEHGLIMDGWFEKRPFLISHGEDYEGEFDDIRACGIEGVTGWAIQDEIILAAMVNDPVDHLLLGKLCLLLARHFGGLVDFGGIPAPWKPDSTVYHRDMKWPTLEQQERDFRAITAGFAGHFHVLRATVWAYGEPVFEGEEKETSTYAFCDADFLGDWLAHPKFRMIK